MCSAVVCKTCKKYTWSGCGQHVEEALYGIPKEQLCSCDAPTSTSGGFFAKLFGGQ